MSERWTRGLLHLMVGGACAALVAWLAFGFTQTVLSTEGAVRVGILALVVLSVALVGVLLLAPSVRPAEIALARSLLDVDVPDPADRGWGARARGGLWALLVLVLGGASLLALLWALPVAVLALVATFSVRARDQLPGWLDGSPPAVYVLVGVALLVLGVGGQPVLITALRRLALPVLGPTARERQALADRERDRLLRANHLARELHDSVGHALTAIGVQAEAGVRVAAGDPEFARAALERIAATTRQALQELDEVLGALRAGGQDGRGAGGLGDVVELLGDLGPGGRGLVACSTGVGVVDGEAARTAYRVVQEGLTNARRHGDGEVTGHVRVVDEVVEIELLNRLVREPQGRPVRAGGRGLRGVRERMALVGGTLEAGPADLRGEPGWRLAARFPARGEVAR